ncbi:GNAT family N-acetyltransferase [Arthrobacter rhombi]|uniref:GNAT family N-acetyltransferase n=1 Tax=Arthrobacter rhombi TaxID=71253 RepID=UPI003FD6867B
MTNISIRWVGDPPTASSGWLAAFTEDGTNVGEASYRSWEEDSRLTYLGDFIVDPEYRKHGIAKDMMRTVFDHLGRERQYIVSLTGNLGRMFMEAVASEKGAPKIFELHEDGTTYRPMN